MNVEDQCHTIAEDVIVQALEAARKRASLAEQQRSQLEREINAAREEQRLLEKLLRLRRNGLPESTGDSPTVEAHLIGPVQTGSGEAMLKLVMEELEAAGRPIHISELMRLLRDRNAQIPGSGTQANLISYLRRDPRVVRPTRGMYALATSGLQNMTTPRRRGRRRKHMRSEKNQERNNP
jgi:hypothetical protein